MTITELQQIHPDATPETWHQHPNGGGWVQNTATVGASARVYGDAQVSGNARVYGNAQVSGNAWVSGDALVSGDAQVYGNARVSGGKWEKSPLYVQGSCYSATNCAPGEIQIGCERHAIAWWQEHGEALARRERFAQAEVEEYRAIVALFAAIGK